MLTRSLTNAVREKLTQAPAVVLLGARQTGKTTLAKTIAKQMPALYLDLEAPDDRIKLSDAKSFLSMHTDKLVILDEIQRAPDLFNVLRGLIDNQRESGRKAGHYLLLGSASMALLQQTSESLAGRISYIEMCGLNLLETATETQPAFQKLWFRGGFPESYLANTDASALDWLDDLIRTYLERDVPQAGFRVPATRLRRLWTMLAHWQGELINYAKLGSNLEIDGKTVRFYLDILSDLLLLRRLEPWHVNVKKRLVKSPRYYIRDSGIQHRLLGINSYDALLANPTLGKSWEGFVIENIQSVLPRHAQTFFYRTAAGAEIDLVIRMPNADIWAIEIKHGLTPKLGKHYSQTCDDVGATQKYIVYSGDDEFPVGNDVTVISLQRLLEKIDCHATSRSQ